MPSHKRLMISWKMIWTLMKTQIQHNSKSSWVIWASKTKTLYSRLWCKFQTGCLTTWTMIIMMTVRDSHHLIFLQISFRDKALHLPKKPMIWCSSLILPCQIHPYRVQSCKLLELQMILHSWNSFRPFMMNSLMDHQEVKSHHMDLLHNLLNHKATLSHKKPMIF